MFCTLCAKATLYIDGKLRCDLEYDQERADKARMCFGHIEGRFKMFHPGEVEEAEKKVQKVKVVRPKVKKTKLPSTSKPKTRKSKIPKEQGKLF